MPGIVGLITRRPREWAEPRLRRMVSSLCHESFYSSGCWISAPQGVYVGWIARQGSFSDGMPVREKAGGAVIVFSGEDFSEQDTVKALGGAWRVSESSPASYLMGLYRQSSSFPEELNGKFHGIVADCERGTATIFNDRFGMHRLHYYQSADAFFFAAESKALLAVCPELRQIDLQGLGEFVSCGSVLEGRTLFSNVSVLPPASAWSFRNGLLASKRIYFHPGQWEDQVPLAPEAYYQELRAVFVRNLPRYFKGPEPIGMSLTGGLDTRMILACRKPDPGTLPCYTFGSMFRENQDVRVARRVADACGQSFQILTAGQEFLSDFPRYAERAVYLTDGYIGVTHAPDLYLNERARAIAPVRMSGVYGGEILRAVRAFKPIEPASGLFTPDFLAHVHGAAETFNQIANPNPVSFTAFQQAPWCLYGVQALEQTQVTMRSPFLDNDFVRTAFRAPRFDSRAGDVSLRLVADGDRSLSRIPTDRGLMGNRGVVMSAASRALREFSFKTEYAYDMGMPQWLARLDHAFLPFHFERLFLGRHKPFHFRVWYRDALANSVRDMLLDSRSLSRPYIDRKGLESIVEGHLRGDRNYTNEIHKVMTLELVHRLFIDHHAEDEGTPITNKCHAETESGLSQLR